MDTEEIIQGIKVFLILIGILTITTEIGFIIQKIIIDLRAIIVAASMAVLMFIIILAKSIVVAIIAGVIIYIFVLDLILNRNEEVPGILLASIVGIGLELLIVISYFSEIFDGLIC